MQVLMQSERHPNPHAWYVTECCVLRSCTEQALTYLEQVYSAGVSKLKIDIVLIYRQCSHQGSTLQLGLRFKASTSNEQD